jgi:hypothetical protein
VLLVARVGDRFQESVRTPKGHRSPPAGTPGLLPYTEAFPLLPPPRSAGGLSRASSCRPNRTRTRRTRFPRRRSLPASCWWSPGPQGPIPGSAHHTPCRLRETGTGANWSIPSLPAVPGAGGGGLQGAELGAYATQGDRSLSTPPSTRKPTSCLQPLSERPPQAD